MGDRCYLELALEGRIETIEAFERIVGMLDAGHWQVNDFVGGRVPEIREVLARGDEATFYLEECNYADISEEETILQEYGVAYSVSHEAGGGYGPGAWSWSPERGTVEVETRIQGGGAAVSITSLEHAMKAADPLAEIRRMIEQGNTAEGCDLPGFSLSDAVREYVGLPVAGRPAPAREPAYIEAGTGI